MTMMKTMAAACLAALVTAGPALADDVIRHKIPNSDFPIARAVEVPAGKTTVYVSGAVPPVADTAAAKNTVAAYGDTKAQTVAVFQSIEKTLKDLGLGLGDVVKMQVFLVGDPAKEGKMDFAGFMEGYRQFYGTAAQPNLPARSALQVAALANPGYLVEIEVTAVRP
ncbi:enamine deaminase RidA (YjgF/YER057c/UK114 family) [Inquilinus ginsengisoli]|uniref:Enamine deaminase RidA (YjgF/YER057c/UK114 family) n=2 Tax=Rhodospirillaceae TaxID=41295 RepID=A0ABU1JT27_9PROT|nr:enamine deaminase RidA (YjgF/YER057c/UK114 family) [Inquilinus ginsengisoli]